MCRTDCLNHKRVLQQIDLNYINWDSYEYEYENEWTSLCKT